MELFKKKFIEDAADLIMDLERKLLELEKNPEEKNLIQEIFRVMHTLKGVSSMYGFDHVMELTHRLETIYDFIRNDELAVSREILNISLASVDHLRYLLQNEDGNDESSRKKHEILLRDVDSVVKQTKKDIKKIKPDKKIASNGSSIGVKTYFILFEPDDNIVNRGISIQAIFDELGTLGQTRSIPRSQKAEKLGNKQKFYIYWELFLVTESDITAVNDVFIFVEEEVKVELVSQRNLFDSPVFVKKITELSELPEPIELSELKKIITVLSDVLDNQCVDKPTNGSQQEHVTTSIKVSSEKLDELMNLVSELVTTKAELSLLAQQIKNPRLEAVAEKVEKLSKQFRDNALNIRLIPINHLIPGFNRMVRDLSHDLGKNVQLLVEGGDTELDKTIIDSISNPLMHIIRNGVDHGIEAEDVRVLKGKPAQGTILLKAINQGSNVLIQISDDGAGINLLKVRQKAISKGMIAEDSIISDQELLNITFTPGFSTADYVTEVSGRGVGLDVVKQKVANIRGEVELESKQDIGTTIFIKLPQTLSIVDTLLVRVDTSHFLIPLVVVSYCSEAYHNFFTETFNKRIELDGTLVPFVYLRNEFELHENIPEIERIVVIKFEGKLIALIVDEIVGEHQAVLKPLGDVFHKQDLISGASILGDGSVALVIDTNRLIKQM
jgi:two-component system chemotaxis sensor kinase CheA